MRAIRRLTIVCCLAFVCGCFALYLAFRLFPACDTDGICVLWWSTLGPAIFCLGALREQAHFRVRSWRVWQRLPVYVFTCVLIGFVGICLVAQFEQAVDEMHYLDPAWTDRLGIWAYLILSYVRTGFLS